MFKRINTQGLVQCLGRTNISAASPAAVTAPTAFAMQRCFQGQDKGSKWAADKMQGGPQTFGTADDAQMPAMGESQATARRPGTPLGTIPTAGTPGQERAPPPPPTMPEEDPKFFKYATNEKGTVTLSLNRAPVNSLSLEFFKELNNWLVWFGYDDNCKSVILTSALATVFSAGLDINELYNPEADRFPLFWTNFQEIWMILNTFPKPVVAAINGNAPAGGCMLALCADIRVMARAPASKPERPYRIGLNETKLGIVAPPWLMGSYSYVLGQRKAERMLQLGETPTAEEALALGLVDKCVDEEQVMAVANQEVEKLMSIPNEARWMSKDLMRQELFGHMSSEEARRYDMEFFGNMVANKEIQKSIGRYLEKLGGGKKK